MNVRAGVDIEHEAQSLMRSLHHLVEDGWFSHERAVEVSLQHLLRDESIAARLTRPRRQALRHSVSHLAQSLDPSSVTSLLLFARAVCKEAHACEAKPLRGPPMERLTDTRSLARASLRAERAFAHDDEDLVRRAVTRALRTQRRGLPGVVRVAVDANDPLRGLLDLRPTGPVTLRKNELRTHLLKSAGHDSPLGRVLRDVAPFSDDSLRTALGPELWNLCRPNGFADAKKTRVLVRVTSSVHAQEVQMRSRELLARLCLIPGFQQVKTLKIWVEPPSVLPVYRGLP